jgi:hypothetical protein
MRVNNLDICFVNINLWWLSFFCDLCDIVMIIMSKGQIWVKFDQKVNI